jgi:serine/threonine-protein kinase
MDARERGPTFVDKIPPVSTSTQVQIGSDFLGYRIEKLIGQGGMGVVYRAYDLRLKRTVALKLIVPELALDERFHARFARETELAMSLEHPNVVPVYDAGDVDGRFYLAMRLVEGTDLAALLRAEGALDPARAFAICSQVANALDAAHGKDLVHRDVKPSNVLLDKSEHVYLADFGLTRRLEEQGAQAGEGRSVGTPAYLAPEQIDGGPVDGRADIYSLGCLLYECLTGEVPFSQDSRLAVAWAHLEEEPPNASAHNSDLPGTVDAVIRKAMAKSRDDRYPTCTALIEAGEEALELRQPSIFRRQGRLVLAAAVALVVVAAAALAAALVMRNDCQSAVSAPTVHENSLVRIDPATNAISDVIAVGGGPFATAVGGDSVWVYTRDDATVTEIDATTNEVRNTTRLSGIAADLGLLTGPVLAADSEGAWIVGVDGRRSLLTRILSSARGKREYRLEPSAAAVGGGALWVLGRYPR